ncbi:molybdopterin biosynthesis protein [Alkalicella caledoniensis]|uniref:Molybdopterin molybdenumtransferase n=1 Tax=Alkalicella caledoniensis TaxID=2731377 RepID=A0A7G9W960_ALKCA|nr:molybdopterin biosynthesis protein [Alkalicella caledoniensis]QNO15222.1 molybdopterin biosynthesis protein [Alkalicella caledoniensis]
MIYLSNTSIDMALKNLKDSLDNYRFGAKETIAVDTALGRVLAENVFANRSVPHYHSSAMDGYQVRAEDTVDANVDNPVSLSWSKVKYVDTGDPILPEYDSVIKIEDIHKKEEGIEILSAATKWQHIRPIGEDVTAHDLLLTIGRKLKPMDIAALIASGIRHIDVFKIPKVAILPTGDEIVPYDKEPQVGEIVDSNSHLFYGMVKEWGGEPEVYPITPDNFDKIKEVVSKAVANSDMVLINAGSSAGSEDFTSQVVENLGEVIHHGIAVRPGKPTILGNIGGKPVIGVPGYPVSGYVVMDVIVKDVFYHLNGQVTPSRKKIEAKLTKPVVSDLKYQEYVRVKVGKINGQFIVSPMSRGSALMSTVVQGDGFLVIPQSSEGYKAGETVQVEVFEEKNYDNTLVSIGSHDMALDILATYLAPQLGISSAHVGSLGGIMALKKGEAHFAGIHLLDPQSGTYNIPYIKKYLKGTKIVLMNLVKRTQGLMVQKGNPKNIKAIGDLPGLSLANRQKGAGTRVLLDYLLEQAGVSPASIQGYNKEYFTHLAVAAEVKSKRADAGVGIYAAAKAMDLDFIPLYEENYDLLLSEEFYLSPKFKELQNVLTKTDFKTEVEALGGYNLEECGNIISLEENNSKI